MDEHHGPRPRYDVVGDLRVQELLDAVRAAGLENVAARLETLLGNAGLELQLLREFAQSVRDTRDMLTDAFAEKEGSDGTKALVAAIRTVLTEDLEEIPTLSS
jgi:hypothetical protein